MLSITAKVRKLAEELDSAITVGKGLQEALESYTDFDKLDEKIGIFARQMPDWRILTEEKQNGLNFVRKICTGEISILEAKELVEKLISELESTRRLIKI